MWVATFHSACVQDPARPPRRGRPAAGVHDRSTPTTPRSSSRDCADALELSTGLPADDAQLTCARRRRGSRGRRTTAAPPSRPGRVRAAGRPETGKLMAAYDKRLRQLGARRLRRPAAAHPPAAAQRPEVAGTSSAGSVTSWSTSSRTPTPSSTRSPACLRSGTATCASSATPTSRSTPSAAREPSVMATFTTRLPGRRSSSPRARTTAPRRRSAQVARPSSTRNPAVHRAPLRTDEPAG